MEQRVPTSFIRLVDGEMHVLQGTSVKTGAVEFHTRGDKLTRLGEELRKAVKVVDAGFFFGIPCLMSFGSPECLESIMSFLNPVVTTSQLTFATIFTDANYLRWKAWLTKHLLTRREAVLIVNEQVRELERMMGKSNISSSRIPVANWTKEVYYVPNEIVDYWELHHVSMKQDVRALAGKYEEGQIFLISAGPAAAVIIYEMWKVNPKNVYLDVGSSIDFATKGQTDRAYATMNGPDLERLSCMNRGGRFGKVSNSTEIRYWHP